MSFVDTPYRKFLAYFLPLALQAMAQSLTYPLVAMIASRGPGGAVNKHEPPRTNVICVANSGRCAAVRQSVRLLRLPQAAGQRLPASRPEEHHLLRAMFRLSSDLLAALAVRMRSLCTPGAM